MRFQTWVAPESSSRLRPTFVGRQEVVVVGIGVRGRGLSPTQVPVFTVFVIVVVVQMVVVVIVDAADVAFRASGGSHRWRGRVPEHQIKQKHHYNKSSK
jgi:hypothetical protein